MEVKRGDVMPQYAGVYVTMNAKGEIVMNRVTHEKMGAPKAFLLLFDKVNSRIGLKSSTPLTRNAYPALVSNRSGAKMVRAYRLVAEHRIILPHTMQFHDAYFDEDGILILDLRTAKVSRRGKGGSKQQK